MKPYRDRGRPGPLGILRMGGLLTTALLVALAACGGQASTPAQTGPQPTRRVVDISGYQPIEIFNEPGTAARSVQFPVDEVWAALPNVLDEMGIPATFIDPQERSIGNLGFRMGRIDGSRPNAFVDCGTSLGGPLANQYEVTLSVVVSLTADGEGTVVQTTIDATAKPRAVSGSSSHCQSRGELELRLANKVIESLGDHSGQG